MMRSFGHFGQGLHELTLRMQKVAQFFDEQFFQRIHMIGFDS
jgi:hypothetical protein